MKYRVSPVKEELTWIKTRAMMLISDVEMEELSLPSETLDKLSDIVKNCKILLSIVEDSVAFVEFTSNQQRLYEYLTVNCKKFIQDLYAE